MPANSNLIHFQESHRHEDIYKIDLNITEIKLHTGFSRLQPHNLPTSNLNWRFNHSTCDVSCADSDKTRSYLYLEKQKLYLVIIQTSTSPVKEIM
jgi:hypothetical protein